MITSINISHVWVFDQDEALDFYVGTLGLEVSADMEFGGAMRWLTVRPKGTTDREVLLEKVAPPSVDPDSVEKIRDVITKGASGFAVGFVTTDANALFADLKAKGVEITEEPTKQFYGTDFGIRDPFGNRIRFVEPATGFVGQ
ncbi:MAG TPA: VOC family protein [Trueperaceae bacterium]|nr:VOC family protein [Trueperaceae bacterium]